MSSPTAAATCLGLKKMPEPITVPTTTASAVNMPSAGISFADPGDPAAGLFGVLFCLVMWVSASVELSCNAALSFRCGH